MTISFQLGLAYREIGRADEARKCWHRALAPFEELGDLRADDVRRQLAAVRGVIEVRQEMSRWDVENTRATPSPE